MPTKRVLLIGSGVSVCGAAAIAAANAAIGAKEEDVALSVGIITLFGSVFMFLYPFLFSVLHMPQLFYAVWAGSSVHAVAQVAVAAIPTDDHFKAIATTVKMIRVLLIVLLTLLLSLKNWHDGAISPEQPNSLESPPDNKSPGRRITIPWFALMFFGVVIINSLFPFSHSVRSQLASFDNLVMTMAMAGLGLELSMPAMVHNGLKVSLLGLADSAFIALISALCTGITGVIFLSLN